MGIDGSMGFMGWITEGMSLGTDGTDGWGEMAG